MSLNFKNANINSSTYCFLTKEQIDSVIRPVNILLTETEVVAIPDSGPVIQSVGTSSTGVTNVEAVQAAQESITYAKNHPLGNIITRSTVVAHDPTGRGITAQQLTLEVIKDFENRTFGSNGTTSGPNNSSAGTATPRGKHVLKLFTENDTGSVDQNVGTSGPTGRA
jgi:hypothetical protein